MAFADRKWSGALTGAILLSAALGPMAHADGEAGLHQVLIQGGEFRPQIIEIKRGERIQWINRDFIPHTATAQADARQGDAAQSDIAQGDSAAWDSGNLNKDESGEIVFDQIGSQPYICRYHPTMSGMVIVREP